jgi:small subunit ribosomal protein S20
MPTHKSTAKRVRTNKRDREKNIAVRSQVRSAVRNVREGSRGEDDGELLRKAHSTLDNAVRKGVVSRSNADRNKSRLAKVVAKSKKKEAKS